MVKTFVMVIGIVLIAAALLFATGGLTIFAQQTALRDDQAPIDFANGFREYNNWASCKEDCKFSASGFGGQISYSYTKGEKRPPLTITTILPEGNYWYVESRVGGSGTTAFTGATRILTDNLKGIHFKTPHWFTYSANNGGYVITLTNEIILNKKRGTVRPSRGIVGFDGETGEEKVCSYKPSLSQGKARRNARAQAGDFLEIISLPEIDEAGNINYDNGKVRINDQELCQFNWKGEIYLEIYNTYSSGSGDGGQTEAWIYNSRFRPVDTSSLIDDTLENEAQDFLPLEEAKQLPPAVMQDTVEIVNPVLDEGSVQTQKQPELRKDNPSIWQRIIAFFKKIFFKSNS